MECPDDHTLARFVALGLDETQASAVREHADGCEPCRRVLATVALEQSTTAGADTDDEVVADVAPGLRFSHYTIVEELGRGASGRVFAAIDHALRRKVALKVLFLDGGKTADIETRFLREAHALAQLNHPNIVDVYEASSFAGQPYLALEFIEGCELGAWLGAAPRTTPEIVAVFEAAGKGLAAAHEAGLCHRDFKPQNVMVADDGRVLVTDFGLAHATSDPPGMAALEEVGASDPEFLRTRHRAFAGTPAYMSPEQWGLENTDARSDQFAFCVAFWEALEGQRPHPGTSIAELREAVCNATTAPVPTGRTPGYVAPVLRKGLSREREHRFADMNELLRALEFGRSRSSRRRYIAVAAVAVAMFTGWAAYQVVEGRRQQLACVEAGDDIDQAYGDLRRNTLRDVIVVDDASPHRVDTFERVDGLLGEYARQWREQRTATCKEGLEGTTDPMVQARQAGCLADRKAELMALVDVLTAGGPTTMDLAVEAAADLPGLDACASHEALLRAPFPEQPDAQRSVREFRMHLANAKALLATGRWDDAGRAAESLVGDDRVRVWPGLQAEALLVAARAHRAASRWDESCVAAEKGFAAAMRTSSDELALDASTELAACELARTNLDAATRWGEMAEHFVSRLALEDTVHHARTQEQIARVEMAKGEFIPAQDRLRAALEIRKTALAPTHPTTGKTLTLLSSAYRRAGQTEAAVETAGEALVRLERAFGPRSPELVDPLEAVGNGLQRLQKFEAAKPSYERAIDIVIATQGRDGPRLTGLYGNLGSALLSLGDVEGAIERFEQAQSNARANLGDVDPTRAGQLINLASAYREAGRLDEAIQTRLRALAIMEEVYGSVHRNTVHALLGLAEDYLADGNDKEALVRLERAVSLADQIEEPSGSCFVARFRLADVLVETGGDEARAVAQAKIAREGLAARGPGAQRSVERIDAWLAARR